MDSPHRLNNSNLDDYQFNEKREKSQLSDNLIFNEMLFFSRETRLKNSISLK